MQIRVVRLRSRNPLAGALLLVVILGLIAFLLTAGLALVAGGAVVGVVGYAVRRLLGGTSSRYVAESRDRIILTGQEVFPDASPRGESPVRGDLPGRADE